MASFRTPPPATGHGVLATDSRQEGYGRESPPKGRLAPLATTPPSGSLRQSCQKRAARPGGYSVSSTTFFRSLRAFFSSWRTRSRVSPTACPISLNVLGGPS